MKKALLILFSATILAGCQMEEKRDQGTTPPDQETPTRTNQPPRNQ